ncbi:MAG: MBL fold metallo-hydrolase [Myxococcota bacterium]
MLFRQLFDPETCTYTYLLADEATREAVLIDAVLEQVDRDAELIEQLELTLRYVLDTHVHADHVTGAGVLRERFGAKTLVADGAGVECADVAGNNGDIIEFGQHTLEVCSTPGHTSGDLTFLLPNEGIAFTGDTLLIRGCGRTDFQQGDARTLYRSVHGRIFTLPDDTLLYPGHDYHGRTVTTVGEEKRFNPRLGGGRSEDAFVEIMAALKLPYPKRIDASLPANQNCGVATQGAGSWAPVQRTAQNVPEVSAAWVHRRGADAGVRIVDVRSAEEYAGGLGHVPGSDLIPLATLEAEAATWDRAASLVVVCRSGRRSASAAVTLERLDFTAVASMRGGMQGWNDAGYRR